MLRLNDRCLSIMFNSELTKSIFHLSQFLGYILCSDATSALNKNDSHPKIAILIIYTIAASHYHEAVLLSESCRTLKDLTTTKLKQGRIVECYSRKQIKI